MVMGRVRTYDRDQIAEDLIIWAKKEDSINLNKFCCTHTTPFPPSKISVWSREDEYFRQSVEIAKSHLAARREEWLNSERLHVKGYDLNASNYDYFIKEERREEKKFDSELASQIARQGTEIQNEKFDKLCDEFRKSQSLASNSAISNINKEAQS